MKSLTIIGCGTVGKTFAKLWHDAGVFSMGAILNDTLDSGFDARKFIGAGRIAQDFQDLQSSDVWMIATPDDLIAQSCSKLANTGLLKEGNLVFHVSGLHTSGNLGPAWASRALTASLHPIKSFVDSRSAAKTFPGTYCTFEGSDEAGDLLEPAIEKIGGKFLSIKAADKPLYHAGTSILCNYLCALVDFGLSALDRSGVKKDEAIRAVEPILRETMENVLKMGAAGALTGPIARGDIETVRRQSEAVEKMRPEHMHAFNALGILATDISALKGNASTDQLEEIRKILNT